MFELYFGNIPSALSTMLFVVFVMFFVKTVKNPKTTANGRKQPSLLFSWERSCPRSAEKKQYG